MPSDAPTRPRDAEPRRDLRSLLDGATVATLGDAELLARYAARPGPAAEEAFAALVARHGGLVRGTCRRILADAADADDAFQGTFLALAAQARGLRLDGPDSLARWLHGVARRVATRARAVRIRHRRRAATERRRLGTLGRPAPEPAGALAHAEALAALDDEVARLPEAFRSALVLCDLGDLTHEQAALALGCPVGTIKSRLARGRDRLRDRLAARGFRPEGLTASGAFPLAFPRDSVPPALVARAVAAAGSLADGRGSWHPPTLIRRWLPSPAGGFAVAAPTIFWPIGLALASGLALIAWLGPPGPTAPQGPPAPAPPPVAAVRQAPSTSPPTPAPILATQPLLVAVRSFADDRPVAGHRVHLRAWEPFREADATTDAAGVAHFTLDGPTRIRGLDVSLGGEAGLVPIRLAWQATEMMTPATVPPDRFTLRTEPATRIGGLVVDPDGRPVAGASVVVDVQKGYPDSTQQLDPDRILTTTDPAGRWSVAGIPARPDTVEMAAWHPLHRTADDFFETAPAVPKDGVITLTLPPRGTPIDGVVVDPAGRPVAGVAIQLGGGAGSGNQVPPVRTDGLGAFHLGIRPGTITTLTATHPGFGPAGRPLTVGDQPQDLTLELPAAVPLHSRVETWEGRPIAGAFVRLGWRADGNLDEADLDDLPFNVNLRTDPDGRFTWPNALAGPIRVEVKPPGQNRNTEVRTIQATAGAVARITTEAPTRIRGRVVDAATGRPVTDFRVQKGTIRIERVPPLPELQEHTSWDPIGAASVAREAGRFEMRVQRSVHESIDHPIAEQIAARIVASDYYSEAIEPVPEDGEVHEVTVRLTRGEPITGRVVQAGGQPATGVTVHCVQRPAYFQLTNGKIQEGRLDETTITWPYGIVGADGTFRLPPQRPGFGLMVSDAAGFAAVAGEDFRPGSTLTLQRWGRVEGTCHLPDIPAGRFVLQQGEPGEALFRDVQFPVAEVIRADVDPSGRFTIPRLTTGRHTIGWDAPQGPNYGHGFVRLATVDVAPDSTTTLRIGASGRAVVGRIRLPDRPASEILQVARAVVEPVAGADPAHLRGVHLLADGRFRAVDLAPGDYRLNLEIRTYDSTQLLTRILRKFPVPAGPTGEPIDLGLIEPEAKPR